MKSIMRKPNQNKIYFQNEVFVNLNPSSVIYQLGRLEKFILLYSYFLSHENNNSNFHKKLTKLLL